MYFRMVILSDLSRFFSSYWNMSVTQAQHILPSCRIKTESNDQDSSSTDTRKMQNNIANVLQCTSSNDSGYFETPQSANSDLCLQNDRMVRNCTIGSTPISSPVSGGTAFNEANNTAVVKEEMKPVLHNCPNSKPPSPSSLCGSLSKRRKTTIRKRKSTSAKNNVKVLHDRCNHLIGDKDFVPLRTASFESKPPVQLYSDDCNSENTRLPCYDTRGDVMELAESCPSAAVFGNSTGCCLPLTPAELERNDSAHVRTSRLSFHLQPLHKRKRPRFLSYCDLTGRHWNVADYMRVSNAYDITPLSATPENVNRLCVGMFVYVVSEVNLNREAEFAHLAKVLYVDRCLSYPRFLIHYIGWQCTHDEWICSDVMFAIVCSFGVGSKLFRRLDIAGYTRRERLDYYSLQPSVDLSVNNICFFASLRKQPFMVNDARIMRLKQEAAAISSVNMEILQRC